MITLRKSSDRGQADHGWLHSQHSFSFADYYDPREMGWGALRVINEDRVEPGQGFGTHGHRDMEIISYVLAGELEHKDSMGNGTLIRPGDVQRMSAGSGVLHSEFNPSPRSPVHFLQIWIEPATLGMAPSYEQKFFAPEDKRGRLRLVASRDGREGSVTLHRDVDLYASLLAPGEQVSHSLAAKRMAYLHLVRGAVRVNGVQLETGDAAKIEMEQKLTIAADADSEVLLFDLD
ncbi:quercetin 2,3-dioxygenase [Dechloromonas denitrificans]|uniref:Quercetin 2,3-dioxygenase n=1 Tax=Dechloromonas denitrificans TaxID=281362 RepID=A0A133XK62_9RHOO|nr:pirin family protein [Dechloromonas denitrificans]KXB31320.1 quercetin 2,3-dioxygenase [Dechloromonas denitrificans]